MGTYQRYESIPNAHHLLASLRSVGYTEEAAIADIVDNCISANATKINIKFDWNNRRILIVDNGYGMLEEDLLKAMKIGSSNPMVARVNRDLGRFGMGMKTAALSLGKKLTVVSKVKEIITNACWDLDFIQQEEAGWNLIISDEEVEIIKIAKQELVDRVHGTAIIIESLDKLIDEENIKKSKTKFYNVIKKVKDHISLVFHRFIEEDYLSISINGNVIESWNPFMLDNSATQELSREEYYQEGSVITLDPYILPHKSKFKNEDEFVKAGGAKGWFQHQGFYVYRNRRLLIYGTWFRIFKKEPSFNLARIKLDICSEYDFDWQIDIKKSKAVPPVYIEELLEQVAIIAAEKSSVAYNSRGTYAKGNSNNVTSLKYVWEQRKNSVGKYIFYLNKKHPLLADLKKDLTEEKIKDLNTYLGLVEMYAPGMISGIAASIGNNINSIDKSMKDRDILYIREMVNTLYRKGFSKQEILDTMVDMDIYSYLIEDIRQILKEVCAND